jgi:hypothetical protein
MRLPLRLTSSLAVAFGALLVAGLIVAPALAGHANMAAASPRRNDNAHAHSTAKAWKSGEWGSDRRQTKAWRKRSWASDRRLAKSCAKVAKVCAAVSRGSIVRTAPIGHQTMQPTTTAEPTPTAEPTTTTPPTSRPRPPAPTTTGAPTTAESTTTTAPTTTICEPTTSAAGGSQLPSTGSRLAHLLVAGLVLGGGGLTILFGARNRGAARGTK